MNFKRILTLLLLIILVASTIAFGSNIPLGPYFDDTYFDLSDSALILKIVPHEKGGLEADVSAYDGLILITGGATSAVTDNSNNWNTAYGWGDHSAEGYLLNITGESIGDLDDVDLTDIANLKILKYNSTSGNWECEDETGGGATTFLGLTDTPAAYTGQAGKYTKVNAGETALEFGTPAGAGTVTTSGTPVQYDYARFIDATTIEGRSYSEMKTDLAYQLSDMSDVGVTTPTDKYVLVADGDSWESRALVEADISDLGTYLENVVEDPTPELGGEMGAGAHSIGFTLQSTTGDGTTTIDWKLGNKFEFTFGAQNDTLTFTAPTNVQNMMLWVIQDGTGSREITWPVTCRWPGGVEGVLSTAGNAVDIVGIAWNGTYYDCVINNAFAVPE